MIELNWSSFKSFVDARALSIQWFDANGNYYLKAIDSNFQVSSILNKSMNLSEVLDFETNYQALGNKKIELSTLVNSIPAFSSKTTPGGGKLFKRVVGIQEAVSTTPTDILWESWFPWVKFMSVEIMGAETGDYCSFYVLDSTTGAYSGIPSYQLNQFGFGANLSKDFYAQKSEFDADVYYGMQIKIVYSSVSAKTIGLNFVMNEVK